MRVARAPAPDRASFTVRPEAKSFTPCQPLSYRSPKDVFIPVPDLTAWFTAVLVASGRTSQLPMELGSKLRPDTSQLPNEDGSNSMPGTSQLPKELGSKLL